ncbi:hypothetical protein ACVW19_002758 [Streptomyces sp. TE5632]
MPRITTAATDHEGSAAHPRFAEALRELGLPEVIGRVRRFPDAARTAPEAAAAIGCELSQICKSLIFAVDDVPVVARTKAREADRRKDWCEKTSTMLARTYGLIRFEKLNITTMTRSAKGTVAQPGTRVRQKAGLNRAILARGWGLLRRRTGEKAPGRVEDVPAPYTSLRCSACGWIEKDSRKSQAEFVCVSCGFSCNADENAAVNVAAGQGGIPRPRRAAGAGGVTAAAGRSSAREPRPTPGRNPPLLRGGGCQIAYYMLLMKSFELGDFGQAYPLARGSAPLLVAVLAPCSRTRCPTDGPPPGSPCPARD